MKTLLILAVTLITLWILGVLLFLGPSFVSTYFIVAGVMSIGVIFFIAITLNIIGHIISPDKKRYY